MPESINSHLIKAKERKNKEGGGFEGRKVLFERERKTEKD